MEEADESQRQKGHRKAKLESGKTGQDRKSKTKNEFNQIYIYIYGYEIGEGEAR